MYAVIDGFVRTEAGAESTFFIAGCGGNDTGTAGLGNLYGSATHATRRAEDKNRVARLKLGAIK